MATSERRPAYLLIEALRFCGLDDWQPGDFLIEVLRFCDLVALTGGVLLALLGVLGGSPEPLDEPFGNSSLIEHGGAYALIGAALYACSWALRRSLGPR